MQALFLILATVFVALNSVGAIVSGIWLAIAGEWGSIGWGLLMMFGAAFLISLALAPGLLIAGPAMILQQRGIKFGFYALAFLSMVYTFAILAAWCLFVLFFFTQRSEVGDWVPHVIWAYGIATGPLAYMAHKDQQSGNDLAWMSTFFAQVGFVVAGVMVLFFEPTYIQVTITFCSIMAVGLLLQLGIAINAEKI